MDDCRVIRPKIRLEPKKTIQVGKHSALLGQVDFTNGITETISAIRYETSQGEVILFTLEKCILHCNIMKCICYLNKENEGIRHVTCSPCADHQLKKLTLEQINVLFWLSWMVKTVDRSIIKEKPPVIATVV